MTSTIGVVGLVSCVLHDVQLMSGTVYSGGPTSESVSFTFIYPCHNPFEARFFTAESVLAQASSHRSFSFAVRVSRTQLSVSR